MQSVLVASQMLCECSRVSWPGGAVPPTAPLLRKTISKQLFDQLVKYLAVTNKLTIYNIPALETKHVFPCQGSAGGFI